MITLDNAVLAALATRSLWSTYLLSIRLGDTTHYITDHYKQLTYSSNDYVPNGRLLSIADVKDSTGGLNSSVSVALSGIDTTFRATAIGSNVIGGEVVINRGFLNDNGSALLADPTELYAGIIHSLSQSDDEEGGTFTISVDVRSEFYHLSSIPGRFTDPSSTRNMITNVAADGTITRNPADTSFDQIATLDGVNLQFGGDR